MTKKKWIQKAVNKKHKGRVSKYIKRVIGNKGFTDKGTIKADALDKALKIAKEKSNTSMERAIILAKRLKRLKK